MLAETSWSLTFWGTKYDIHMHKGSRFKSPFSSAKLQFDPKNRMIYNAEKMQTIFIRLKLWEMQDICWKNRKLLFVFSGRLLFNAWYIAPKKLIRKKTKNQSAKLSVLRKESQGYVYRFQSLIFCLNYHNYNNAIIVRSFKILPFWPKYHVILQ